MKAKIITFDSSKQSIGDLIEEIANSVKKSIEENNVTAFKEMIADTQQFINWAKDYTEIDDLIHQNIIVALNNLKKVDKKDIEHLNEDELNNYYHTVNNIEIILYNYTRDICKQVRSFIDEIIDEKNKKRGDLSCKFTKEELNKLRKEELINMIIDNEEPKKNPN